MRLLAFSVLLLAATCRPVLAGNNADCGQHVDIQRKHNGCSGLIEQAEAEGRRPPSFALAGQCIASQFLENQELALRSCTRAIEAEAIPPGTQPFGDLIYGRAAALASLGRLEEALDELPALNALKPRYIYVETIEAELYWLAGEWTEAGNRFDSLVRLDPTRSWYHFRRGFLNADRRQLTQAQKDFETAILLMKNERYWQAGANMGLAWISCLRGDATGLSQRLEAVPSGYYSSFAKKLGVADRPHHGPVNGSRETAMSEAWLRSDCRKPNWP